MPWRGAIVLLAGKAVRGSAVADTRELYGRADRAYGEILRLRDEGLTRSAQTLALLFRCAISHEDTVHRLALSVERLEKAGRYQVIENAWQRGTGIQVSVVCSEEDHAPRQQWNIRSGNTFTIFSLTLHSSVDEQSVPVGNQKACAKKYRAAIDQTRQLLRTSKRHNSSRRGNRPASERRNS